jgi:GNAT superfamily N-acetyltransferase
MCPSHSASTSAASESSPSPDVVELGVELPAGHTLVSYVERPDLIRPASRFNGAVWPEFLLQDATADEHWHLFDEEFPGYQLVLLDESGEIAATNNSAPLRWDGTDTGLPEGWDDQVQRTARDLADRITPNTLGAIQIVVDPRRRGQRLGGLMATAMLANAKAHGYPAVIACVRPTDKERYPLVPIERYIQWSRPDGEPFDAWIRLHVRLGARVVRGSPRAMTIRGSIGDWERWTGMLFPDSGEYVVPGGAATVGIDRGRDEGVYFDPNVWVVHSTG